MADLENAFRSLDRTSLRNSTGISYTEFRNSLTPRFGLAWFHVACGYCALIAISALVIFLERRVPLLAGLPIGLAGACCIGYWIHFMHLFMHEGSHFNMAPNKKWNDRLTNAFVGTLVGIHMKPYRPNHLNHHRHLGTPKDTEISYFDPLNLSFFLQSLLGLRVFKVLLNWGKVHKIESIKTNKYDKWLAYRALVTALLLHGIICGIAIWQGAYIFAVAWAFGTCGVYPFFAALRTVLEHRSEDADKTIDYHFVDHGKVNRMFGIGPVASTLGHAGFNRHLLHHMEPQISYTRLRELETFLYDTSWGREQLPSFRTTYARTFARLFNK